MSDRKELVLWLLLAVLVVNVASIYQRGEMLVTLEGHANPSVARLDAQDSLGRWFAASKLRSVRVSNGWFNDRVSVELAQDADEKGGPSKSVTARGRVGDKLEDVAAVALQEWEK